MWTSLRVKNSWGLQPKGTPHLTLPWTLPLGTQLSSQNEEPKRIPSGSGMEGKGNLYEISLEHYLLQGLLFREKKLYQSLIPSERRAFLPLLPSVAFLSHLRENGGGK